MKCKKNWSPNSQEALTRTLWIRILPILTLLQTSRRPASIAYIDFIFEPLVQGRKEVDAVPPPHEE